MCSDEIRNQPSSEKSEYLSYIAGGRRVKGKSCIRLCFLMGFVSKTFVVVVPKASAFSVL